MKILLTGSKGFIASHCPFECNKVDLGDEIPDKKYDVVIHLAAFMHDEPNLWDNNIDITGKILQLQPEAHVIFTSSAAVYGNAERFPIVETDTIAPINEYGVSKMDCEELVREMPKHTIFRLSNVYPKEDSAYGKLKNGGKIYGDGTQIRDFVHVNDVWSAIIEAMNSKIYGTFNISSGYGVTINKFYRDNFHKEPQYEEAPYKEISVSILDNSKWSKSTKS